MLEGTGAGGPHMQTHFALMMAAAGTADSTADVLDGLVSGLMTNLEPMLSEFRGSAGTKFQHAQDIIINPPNAQLPIMVNALRSLASKLGVASTNYANAGEQMEDVIDTVVQQTDAGESDIMLIMQGAGPQGG
jgi:uncharacterized protein YukE